MTVTKLFILKAYESFPGFPQPIHLMSSNKAIFFKEAFCKQNVFSYGADITIGCLGEEKNKN